MDALPFGILPSGDLAHVIYLAVFAAAAAGCLAGAWRARRQVSLPGVRRGLVGLLSASGLWALCHVGVLLSPSLGLKVAFYEAGLIVGFGTVFAWLWLCSAYSGRALHRRPGVRWAALILFVAVTLAKLTNRWHGLYFGAEQASGPFPHLAVDHHVIYWLTAGLSYALAAVGFCMLAEPLRRAQVGGGKLAGLFGLTALPLGANAIGYATPYLVDLSHEPVGVAAFALGAFALKRGQLEEASRAGREERPSLVLSAGGRVQNYNQAAAELLPALREGTPKEGTPKEGTPKEGIPEEGTPQEEEIAGRHLEEALPRLARALEVEKMSREGSGEKGLGEEALSEDALNGKMLDEGMPGEETLEVAGAGGEARYYRPVESQAGPGAERLVVLQDVTERELRRRERASRLEAISDSMPGLAFEFRAGPGGKRSVEFIGEEAGSFLGLSSGLEEAFERFTEHVSEGHREEFRESVGSAVEGRSAWRHEFPFDRPGGERIWLLGSAEPSAESGPGEEEVVFRGTLADITERKRREQELRETRRELRREKRRAESITENVSEGIYRSTEEGIVYANSAFIEMFGYRDLEELREAGPEALYVDPSRREELIEKEHRHGRLRQEEVRYRRKDGTVFIALLSSQQVEGEEGKTYFDGAITDITERKEEERRRKQTAQRVTDAIVEVDSEWRFTLVNDQAEEFYEMAEDNLLGKNFWDVFPQVEGTRFEEVYREAMRSREPAAIEEHYSGMGEWFDVQVYPNGDGGLDFYFRVITERKEREEALREAKRRYQTLIENFPDGGAYLFDEDLRYVLAGGEKIGIVGGPEEIIGSTVYDILPEGLAEEQQRHYRRALEGKRGDFEQEYDGRRYRVQTLPVRNEDGTVTSGIVFSQDITERRRRKEKLKQRKKELERKREELKQRKKELERKNDLFERAQEIASVGAWEYDVRADENRWTDQVHRIYGHKDPPGSAPPPENAIEAYHPDDRPAIREAFTEAVEEGTPYDIEVRLITEEGEERWVRTRGEPQREDRNREDKNPDRGGGNPEGEVIRVRGTIQDITERKKREETLHERQEKLESLYEATNHLLQAEGPEDLSARLSSLVRQALGHSATTIRLARGGKLVPAHVPSVVQERMPERPSYDVDGDTPAAEAHRTGETRAFEDLSAEFEAMARGDIRATAYVPMGRYGLISVGSFEAGGIGPFDLRLLEVLGSYAALVLERLKREEELLTAKEEVEQARQESEEARQEAEEAKEEAQEASRLKSALLANMSHEIRTPLTSIIGFAEMLGREAAGLELPEESPLPGYASTIEQSGKRLLETLNGVLNLSKLQAGQMEMEAGPTCLPEQARLAAEELRPEAEEKEISLELETGGGPAAFAEADIVANADEGGVQIVLRNLLSNAIKYTEEGRVTVRTYREDGDQEDGDQEDGHPQEDSWAVLEVEDTGIGMDSEVAEGLFEPFRQASEGLSREYEGTGIGLAVTREAVAQMGGSIEVETQKGAGTCMTVRLPLAGEAGAA
ncbi:PAS domain S-box protein [Salinibacter ruber]|uniref:PAS domain S-box protein n=1 Tax=Salinibacter ruber TaxID=146919 RepID=UPI002168C73C|nr:PAS domain S-box protein [Salinibacter ruber]MCS4119251.1 PAS domain S-box-containing protein [Salinibacter ruber]MCS4178201.1 PAS domain S-box-containing protein [Salinibacter ruber]MCS4187666.1 PAS domain S-box-containing protein [Salinibacter ruber]